MFFLFDENVPYKFVRGLSLIEEANYKTEISAQISHPKDINNQVASDEAQIEYADIHNGVIVSFDKDFKHMISYYPLYKQFKVGVIVLNLTKKESNYWGIVKAIINRWEELKIAANETERPFVLEITSKGVEKRNF